MPSLTGEQRPAGRAMLVLCLLLSVAVNLFTTFYQRNLKPAVRGLYDTLAIAPPADGGQNTAATGVFPAQARKRCRYSIRLEPIGPPSV